MTASDGDSASQVRFGCRQRSVLRSQSCGAAAARDSLACGLACSAAIASLLRASLHSPPGRSGLRRLRVRGNASTLPPARAIRASATLGCVQLQATRLVPVTARATTGERPRRRPRCRRESTHPLRLLKGPSAAPTDSPRSRVLSRGDRGGAMQLMQHQQRFTQW